MSLEKIEREREKREKGTKRQLMGEVRFMGRKGIGGVDRISDKGHIIPVAVK